MPDVRSSSSYPIASDFASGKGTPLVVNQSNGRGYVMKDDDSIAPVDGNTIDLRDFDGIDLTGSNDSTTDFQAAITQASHGDVINIPRGVLAVTGITVNKRVRIQGAMAYGEAAGTLGAGSIAGSVITGTGDTLLTLTTAVHLDNLTIFESAGHADAVGISIANGSTPVINWRISNCVIVSYKASGFGTLGTGIKAVFGLIGVVENCVVRGWGTGIDWEEIDVSHRSNANDIRGCTIEYNTIGVKQSGADTACIWGSTIEGNSTGIKQESGRLTVSACHFENNQGDERQIHVTDGNLTSVGNGFYVLGTTDLDIYIESGSGVHSSISDTLNAGVKHNGTGMFNLMTPVLTPVVDGTGRITYLEGAGQQLLQGSSDMFMTGFDGIQVDSHFALAEVGDPSGTANKGKLYVRDNGAGKSQLCVIFGSGATQVIATEP